MPIEPAPTTATLNRIALKPPSRFSSVLPSSRPDERATIAPVARQLPQPAIAPRKHSSRDSIREINQEMMRKMVAYESGRDNVFRCRHRVPAISWPIHRDPGPPAPESYTGERRDDIPDRPPVPGRIYSGTPSKTWHWRYAVP